MTVGGRRFDSWVGVDGAGGRRAWRRATRRDAFNLREEAWWKSSPGALSLGMGWDGMGMDEERGAVGGCAGHTADDDAIRAAEAISPLAAARGFKVVGVAYCRLKRRLPSRGRGNQG